jgi:transposase-like protein
MALSNEEYIVRKAQQCPICNSYHIEAGASTFDGHTLTQEIECHECGAMWDDVYETTLTGYDNLEEGE